eukprot:TRINITY_DN6150_c0_g2_i7.p1 TRINITY_DN6150_c0_g2~~TRINITY_DN6150_c0_g2_i7.p1  ORF type:complete len:951 (+),score=169.05 TRINITY_DN6150_c0_g2_i7:247-2853(+)
MSSPSKDEASENLGGSFLYDGSDDLSNTGISPTRRSLLSLPPNKQDTFLSASLNGTIYLVESDSGKVHWSFSSGTSLSSSYQAYDKNARVLRERNGAKSIVNNKYFVECGDDWNLYMHTTRGKMKLPVTIEEFVESTPHYLEDGAIIVGEKKKIVFCVDANTGRVIRTFPAEFENDVQGILSLKQYMGDKLKSSSSNIQTTDLLFITRTNYKLESYFLDSNEVAWNMTVSDLDFQYRCSGFLEYQGDEMPFPCHIKGVVYRTREHNPLHSELRFLESRREDEMLFLPAPQTQGKETDDGKEIVPEIFPEAAPFLQRNILFDPSFIVGVAFLFTVFGVVLHCVRQKRHDKSNQQSSDSNRKQTSSAKKRKTQKIEQSKNNAHTNNLETHISSKNKDGKVDMDPLLNLTKAIENGDGRWVGKLFVSNKEIAKGSNGTVVFEGVYDRRIQVAVKRLVLAHNDVALKEYDNLIASKQHPNIVRWFGVEQDSDFFYLPLERCTCNLNDLIGLYSDAFPNSLCTENPASYNVNEYKVQLKPIKGIDKDTDLWQVNGYPSSKLLNLMRDVVAGLAHLHELGIIHRDLKPQNVLITCEKSLCAKLSDMGISKRLNEGMSSLGHHATGYGSSGWQAPEQILHGRQTRAVDLFSLGCVLFFCITKGKHPFGERLERDSNIVKNRFDLFLVEHIPEAVDLFSQLLHPKPEKRPKAKEVLHHPFFWNSMVRLWFLREVSDKVELKDKVGESDLLKALENTAPVALGGNWDEKMEASFITNFGRQRRYKYNSIRDLLRLIRNKLNHYGELPKEIQELLGSVPEGFYNYFASRFPKLFIEVYKVIYNHCRKEDNFRIYFTGNNLHKTVGGQLQDLCSELQHG